MEANFIGEVGDIYKCIVCHLVLKDPVLIVDCGHRLCKLCFESLRGYATENNKSLLCPHDRKEVNADKVVDDKGVARTVLDLQVHCNNNREGCTWTGELRQLDDHVGKWCHVTSLKKFMEEVERRLEVKDKEMEELQEQVSAKDSLVKELEGIVLSTRQDVSSETDRRLLVEQRLKDVEVQLREKNEEIAYLKYEMSSLRLEFVRDDIKKKDLLPTAPEPKKRKTRLALVDCDKENQSHSDMAIANSGCCGMDEKSNVIEDFTTLKREIKELDKKISRIELRNISFNNDVLRLQDAKVQDEIVISRELNKDCPSDCIHCKQHQTLVKRLMNVHTYVPNKRTEFVWKLKHYAYHEDVGKNLVSPEFYSSLHGHCCCLVGEWSKDKSFGLYFRIRLGVREPDEAFAMSVQLFATDINGNLQQCTLTKEEVRDNATKYAIMPGEKESSGRGFSTFLTYPGLEDFIINDVLTIVCVLSDDD